MVLKAIFLASRLYGDVLFFYYPSYFQIRTYSHICSTAVDVHKLKIIASRILLSPSTEVCKGPS